jgi:hypothetical protein
VTDQSKQTLMTLQRLLDAKHTETWPSLVAAFSLGRLEGLSEMAALGQDKMESVMEEIHGDRVRAEKAA